MYILFYYEIPELTLIDPTGFIYVITDYNQEAIKEMNELRGKRIGVFSSIKKARLKQCQHALSQSAINAVN